MPYCHNLLEGDRLNSKAKRRWCEIPRSRIPSHSPLLEPHRELVHQIVPSLPMILSLMFVISSPANSPHACTDGSRDLTRIMTYSNGMYTGYVFDLRMISLV